MKALTTHAREGNLTTFDPRDSQRYVWRRDFPVSLQNRTQGLESIFRLEFSLDDREVGEFKRRIKSNLNGTLPIEVKFGRRGVHEINVRKQGPGGSTLSKKSPEIAKYVADHIHFIYIPAIRTEDEATEVVQEMLSSELATLEKDQEYANALQKIADLQQPILDRVSNTILTSLRHFLPNIKAVNVRVAQAARRVALRSQCQIEIDDGTATLLDYKGDGVKSLAALGLIKDRQRPAGASIVAIEEPESHLHPGAMHSLRDVIDALSSDNQVVITTHCPLFVDREVIARNIVIADNTAKPASGIASIRSLLGVRASDNLVNASHVLVVEGAEDVTALRALLPTLSQELKGALEDHRLVIEAIGGAGNLAYKLSTLANALCVTHVLLDNDQAGKEAFDAASRDGLLKLLDVTFANCQGMRESELEDIYDLGCYEAAVVREFGVDLRDSAFRGRAKWSLRAKACFERQGKTWDRRVAAKAKAAVASAVERSPSTALNSHRRAALDALVVALVRKIQPPTTDESSGEI